MKVDYKELDVKTGQVADSKVGTEVEVSGQVFGCCGFWTEICFLLSVGRAQGTRLARLIGKIAEQGWQLILWCSWVIFVLGE